jgi:hypothetical protein
MVFFLRFLLETLYALLHQSVSSAISFYVTGILWLRFGAASGVHLQALAQ